MEKAYLFSQILPAREEQLLNDCFIVLLHAHHTPPHLYFTINGWVFTLNVNGASVDRPLPSLLQLIKRKKIGTLFIRLTLPPILTMDQIRDEVRACFRAYQRADTGVATCLSPINDFCSNVFQTDRKRVHLIFDLLPELEKRKAFSGFYHLNLEEWIGDNVFRLQPYTVANVNDAIRKSTVIPA